MIFQQSKQGKPLKFKFNPVTVTSALLLLITVFFGLTAIDNYRFDSRITKPEHRYFSDPNQYLEIPNETIIRSKNSKINQSRRPER